MKNTRKTDPLAYLQNKPIRVYWKVVAGGELTYLQQSDLIFDEYDLKIRQLPLDLLKGVSKADLKEKKNG